MATESTNLIKFSEHPLVRVALFVGGLVGLWLPGALLWLFVTGWRPGVPFDTLAPFQLLGVSVALYGTILAVLWIFAHRLDGRTLAQYGLGRDWTNLRLAGLGLAIGVVGLSSLLGVEAALGWLSWHPEPVSTLGGTLVEGLVVALAVGFIEELLFRGFLLQTFARRSGLWTGAMASALLFAAVHFIKAPAIIFATLPQFPALFAAGLLLAFARFQGGGRLGLAVGLHTGWIWTYYLVSTRHLIRYDRPGIPEWLTGIGHPLAGVAGVVLLVAVAVLVSRLPRPPDASAAESIYS
ncbi:CPBP family intramembrane glutamic endopeptidase [Gloeobacter kilaueensis]|uniref:Abortive infection protein n=1 Tax=Gloeobacter kilaueensis (strain ATCC BAA-2537 / CCAP 1431/1 / ULC 316 / JS1) TaxID=1183438 RepID=U5QJT3_GLOK1|nr:type II CAAX endopeptidase family protein [Gloeobacter kilaueensis]AGY59153.1 abortive infection protein [Gloeobacter kilaueensis JS1]